MFLSIKSIKRKAHERFEEPKLEAVSENNVELIQDILKELNPLIQRSQAADELVRILKEPHFQVCRVLLDFSLINTLKPLDLLAIRCKCSNYVFFVTLSTIAPSRPEDCPPD